MKKTNLFLWALMLCLKISYSQSLLFNYAKAITSSQGVNPTDMRIDSLNNFIYVTGSFGGVTDFDMSAATFTLSPIISSVSSVYIAKYTTTGNFVWAKAIGNSSNNNPAKINFDALGNVYVAGSFLGTLDFDPSATTFTMNAPTAFNTNDAFFAKYDANGNFVYAKAISGVNVQYISDIELNNLGEVYVCGAYAGLTDFAPSGISYTLTSITTGFSSAGFIAKYDVNGNYVYVKPFNSANNATSIILEDIILENNDIYATGYFNNTVDFDPNAGSFPLSSNQGFSGVILKLDNLGNFTWAKQLTLLSAGGRCIPKRIKKLNQKLYLTGNLDGIADFDASASNFTITTNNSFGFTDVFTTSYDLNGNFIWANSFGGTGTLSDDFCSDLYVTKGGDVFIPGSYNGTADFNPGVGVSTPPLIGTQSVFLNCLDTLGIFKFVRTFNSTNYSTIENLYLDGNSVFCYGSFAGTCDFDVTNSIFNLINNGAAGYLARYEIDPVPSCTFAVSQNSTCSGSCISFTSGTTNTVAVTSRLWNFVGSSNTPTSNIQNPTNVCYGNVGNYTVSLTCSNTVGSSVVTKTLLVNALPSVSITPSVSAICKGRTVTLTAIGANSYSWNTGLTSPQVSISPTITTSYSVTGTNSTTGCSKLSVSTITVNLCAGIEPIEENGYLTRVGPNPFFNFLNINSDAFINKALIYNSIGQIVHTESVLSKSVNLNLEILNSGIYFVRIETEYGSEVKRVIKE